MSKAYDRVEWGFLEAIMIRMGFALPWVSLLMRCVTSVSYSIRINQNLFGELHPHRGLRQGDPLSPFLFAISAQGFSAIINRAATTNLFRGVKIAHNCPTVSHLFFADASLIFFRATRHDCLMVKRCINLYEVASGQVVNFEKSAITFCPSSAPDIMNYIQHVLIIPVVSGHELYLWLATFSLRRERVQFSFLQDCLFKRINSWTSKFFSSGGKEVLIKSVLQAIPTYAMSCFKIPFSICKDIEQLCAKFWWRANVDRKGLHWAS